MRNERTSYYFGHVNLFVSLFLALSYAFEIHQRNNSNQGFIIKFKIRLFISSNLNVKDIFFFDLNSIFEIQNIYELLCKALGVHFFSSIQYGIVYICINIDQYQ